MGKWYEAYPGLFFLDNAVCMPRVGVDARGYHCIAYIERKDAEDTVYYEECASVEEAQGKAEAQYRYLLEQELSLLAPEQ